MLEEVRALLASTAASGIDEKVAGSYEEARAMLEQAHNFFERGDAEAAIIRAQTAQAKLESEVIEPQDSARREWHDLSVRASEASKQIHTMNIPLGLSIVPRKMEELFHSEREMVAALSAGDAQKLAEAVSVCEAIGGEIRKRLVTAQDSLQLVENVIQEVDELLASASASGIDEIVAQAYDEARRMLEEAKSFFEGGDAAAAQSIAEAARVKIERDVVEPGSTAQREWNELSQKAIEVSEQIQAMNIPVVLRVSPEKMETLFQMERDMIGSLSERDRETLAEAVSVCERLVEEIRHEVADAMEILRRAETEIEETVKFLAMAAASGIDEKVARAYDESRQILEEAKSLFDHGDSAAALERAQEARRKLQSEVIELQDSLRQAWLELAHRADRVFENIRALDFALALNVAKENLENLFEAERRMAVALCERNSEKLAEAVSTCERLFDEIEQATGGVREGLQLVESRLDEVLERINGACSVDAMHYCPHLVNSLRVSASEVISAFALRDLEKLEAALLAVQDTIQSIETTVADTKSEHYSEFSRQLAEIEDAVQQAVQRCEDSYSPDVLEEAYSDLSRIKERLSGGPDAITAALDSLLGRELAVARTKVLQVEAMRERVERERQEAIERARRELASAREAIDAAAQLDFADESSPSIRTARDYVNQADGLIVEQEIEASFERLRQAMALTDRTRAEANEKEAAWRELAGRLMADDAPHKAMLSDPATGRAAEEERSDLAGLGERTQSIIDAKDLGALEAHAQHLAGLTAKIAERVETWKKARRAQIEEKLAVTAQELRSAEMMGATKSCPDIFNAAVTFLDIAKGYLAGEDFDGAEPAADDALAKSREAGTLAKANSQRESALALDYMKIAAAHIQQQNHDAAKQALDKGLDLIRSAGIEETANEHDDEHDGTQNN
jgi:tetratricopeptide (TPR) repeat protein